MELTAQKNFYLSVAFIPDTDRDGSVEVYPCLFFVGSEEEANEDLLIYAIKETGKNRSELLAETKESDFFFDKIDADRVRDRLTREASYEVNEETDICLESESVFVNY